MPDLQRRLTVQTMVHDELIARAAALIRPRRTPDGRLHGDVGAVVVSADGKMYEGICVDTPSWGLCAERSALAAMITQGQYQARTVVAVWRNPDSEALHVLPPCGVCREFLRQIDPGNLDTEIVLGRDRSEPLRRLLPHHDWPAPL